MNTLQIFANTVSELELLPKHPKIFWYPSAGNDFRGLVAYTQYHINHELVHHGRDYVKPDLFVYNCIGKEVTELKQKLENGDVELWNDHSTRMTARNYQSLQLRDDIIFETNENYIDTENLNLNDFEIDRAFYFELEVSGHNYHEIQRVLYFQAENIDFFNKIILSNIFETSYMCTTQEGIAWGYCKKSVVDYIYQDNHPQFFSEHGFRPIFNILSRNFTKQIFEDAVENSDSFSIKSNYGNFISESDDFTNDSIIYKINY